MKTGFWSFVISSFLLLPLFSGCVNEKKMTAEEEADIKSEDTMALPEKQAKHQEVKDLIQVISPKPGTVITSPLLINGKARGPWFFEGDFPIRLLDAEGKEISVAIATAQGEWMTEEWVEFEASMEFTAPSAKEGVLVFEKSNPSDKRELDREFRVKVRF